MDERHFFRYTALSGKETKKATVEARDEREVRAILREQGLVPIEIKRGKGGADKPKLKPAELPSIKEFFASPPEGKPDSGQVFHYKAILTETGAATEGEIVAADEREVRQILRGRGMLPSDVRQKKTFHSLFPSKGPKPPKEVKEKPKKEHEPKKAPSSNQLSERFAQLMISEVPATEILFYVSQLATMNESGLAFSQSMEIMTNLITHKQLKKIHIAVREDIMQGVSLTEAYRKYEKELPRLFIELISVGEVSGNLDNALHRLKSYLESQVELNKKIKGAMTYPMVMIGLISLIVMGLMIFVVPTFVQLFSSFKVELPPNTKMLLAMSWFITHQGYLIPVIGIGGFVGFKAFMASAVGRQLKDFLEFRLPVVGNLAYKITISRILHNLGLFLTCGITIVSALDMILESQTNKSVIEKLNIIRSGITSGERLSSLFIKTELFPPLVNYLLIAGEEAGAVDELIERGAVYVDKEVEGAIKMLTSAIEPMLTVVVAGVILFVVGSLYLPLVGLMKGGSGGPGH